MAEPASPAPGKLPRRYDVGAPADVPVGKRKIVDVPGLGEVGIFNIRGEFFAVRNVCPHQGGPMCRGKLTGTTEARFVAGRRPELAYIRDGEILRCPWHAWEFDIRTGAALFSDRTRIVVYDVKVAPGEAVPPDDGGTPTNAETYPVSLVSERLVIEIPVRRREAAAAAEKDDADAG